MSFAAFTISPQTSAQADTFGTSGNEFTLDFVNIGNVGNAADTTGYGAVPYEYRIGIYEISQDVIERATASGLANVTAGAWLGSRPAAFISWYEAAAFVNWLNTSTGKSAAYDMIWDGSTWSMNLWSSGEAWQLGGENLYRHKDAYYFLPSENEWYKAAYHKNDGITGNYWVYPTGSDAAPTAVVSGTATNTAVYEQLWEQGVAPVETAGGLSPYGTMGQGGNIWEMNETAFDGTNDSVSERRTIRGGYWSENYLWSSFRGGGSLADPSRQHEVLGFRVASVPEPSTFALLAMTAAGALWLARRRR